METKTRSHNPTGDENKANEQATERDQGRFRKGESGNPAGRPRGRRNVATLAAEAMLEGEAGELTKKAIELAKAGNLVALRLCLDRVLPPRRSRLVTFDLPSIKTAEDIVAAHQAVINAVADGQLTLDEAHQFVGILEATRQAIETVQLAEDIASLKEQVGLGK